MAACANGASVRPTWTAGDVILSVAGAGLLTVSGIAELAPFLVDSPVIGSIAAQGLCNLNPDDPGDFQMSYLLTPTTLADLPSPASASGTMSWWIWHKVLYWFFQQCCQCNVTNAPPPTPIAITPVTNYDTSVNLTENQTQLTQIQNTLVVQDTGSKELYNGLQHVSSLVGDFWVRSVPNVPDDFVLVAQSVTGEGAADLPILPPSQGNYFSTYALIMSATVEQLGPRVGIRGTRNPRLYGVGSLYFEYDQRAGQYTSTFDRHSIHYVCDSFTLPARQIPMRVAWRLMPGCVVTIRVTGAATDNVMTSPTADTRSGWIPFGNYTPPTSWTDPPIYPSSARRIFPVAGGSADYLELASPALRVPDQVPARVVRDENGCGCPGLVDGS